MANASAGATGALSGAATGAALGSVVPGIGTAIGAVGGGLIGGLAGLFSDSGGDTPDVVNPLDDSAGAAAQASTRQNLYNQQAFVDRLNAQNGVANQSSVFGQQQLLANQLQQQANGQGPNVALNQLNQTTGQNVANQAALMAGQRGASANSGLIARQAAMQGANTQQQAVGQAATLGAQQQIAAQQALMQQQQALGNTAGSQIGEQQQAMSNAAQTALGNQNSVFGAIQGSNAANNQATQIGNQASQAQSQQTLGMIGGAGGAISALSPLLKSGSAASVNNGISGASALSGSGVASGAGGLMVAAHGGAVPDMPSDPSSIFGKHLNKAIKMKSGGAVPGRASVKGDSYANDKVAAVLSPGEVVLPRHVMNAKDAPKAAAEFVRQVMAKKGLKK